MTRTKTATLVVAACLALACGDSSAPTAPSQAMSTGGSSSDGAVTIGSGGSGAASAGGTGGAPVDEGLDLGGGVTLTPSVLAPGASATITYRGTLAGAAELVLHYGFDGWSELAGARNQEDDGTGNVDFYLETPMQPLADEPGFALTIDLPATARALHFVFRDGASWDNNGGADYNSGVPFPYLGPYLTWDGTTGPEDGAIVSFVTGHSCIGWVAYGESPALGAMASEPAEARVHHVRLAELPADSTIHYKIGCASLEGEDTHAFHTAPANPSAFHFLVLGDMQDDGENGRWADVAENILTDHDDAAFLVVTGDMPWNDRPGLWWTFFDRGRELFASKVMMPVAGNHDTPGVDSSPDTTSFERFFPMPPASGSPTYYQFDFGTARLFACNSERGDELAPSGAQLTWLAQELAGSLPTWVFVYWHIPPYNAGSRHFSQQGSFRDATASFDGAVDWFFGGHEHLYQRHEPLRYNGTLAPSGSYGRGAEDGVGYLIVPPAGVWPGTELIAHDDPKAYYRDRLAYPLVSPPNDVAPSELGFVDVAIDDKSIALTSYGLGTIDAPAAAHVVDAVSYTKP